MSVTASGMSYGFVAEPTAENTAPPLVESTQAVSGALTSHHGVTSTSVTAAGILDPTALAAAHGAATAPVSTQQFYYAPPPLLAGQGGTGLPQAMFTHPSVATPPAPKKPSRDPGAPKRNLSAYLLYQNAMREQFKAANPGMTFGQLSKYTSAMYAEMPPAEKQAWVARAEADKQRYLTELASYVPPPGYDAKGDAMNGPFSAKSVRRPSSANIRDANAPKRNMSAYLLYQNAMRDQFKRENPGMTFGQLAKYTSHMYKNLTPEEKATWDARAAQDKARYDAQMANYIPPPGHDAKGNLIDEHHRSNTGGSKRSKRNPKDKDAPKRARGSFVFFTFTMRPIVMKEFPDIKFVDMGTILGERWRALTPTEKKQFENMASEDKIRFNVEMARYNEQLHRRNVAANIANMQHKQLQEQQQQQVLQQQQQALQEQQQREQQQAVSEEVDQDLHNDAQLGDALNFDINAGTNDLNTYQHHQYKEEDQFQM